jgi:hypothetical protein
MANVFVKARWYVGFRGRKLAMAPFINFLGGFAKSLTI